MKLLPFITSSLNELDIDAQLVPEKTGFLLSFEVTGKGVDQVVLADPSAKPSRKNDLWKETCFECFFGVGNSKKYFEFNGSPSGDWALYSFDDYRAGMKDVALKDSPKLEKLEKSAGKILVEWRIPYFTDALLQSASVNAVVKTTDSAENSYWALHHAGEKADFHLRKNFIHRFI